MTEVLGIPLLKILLAIFLGGLIGFERELVGKPAGLRTHILVTGSVTFLVILGEFMVQHFANDLSLQIISSDPTRVMKAIISGISFLGAGTIIYHHQQETVEGLTTAASILFVSALGMAVAIGQYLLAAVATVLLLIILTGLTYFENYIQNNWRQ